MNGFDRVQARNKVVQFVRDELKIENEKDAGKICAAAGRQFDPPRTKRVDYTKRDTAVALALEHFGTVSVKLAAKEAGLRPNSARHALKALVKAGKAVAIDDQHYTTA